MQIPVIDLAPYLEFSRELPSRDGEEFDSNLKNLCSEVSRTLRETGALLVKDPRCTAEDNDRFLDMMEKYFEMPDDFKRRQERPHLHYQVGVTPEGVEVPRSLVDAEMQQKLRSMPKEFQPSTPSGPDPKWRYMWRELCHTEGFPEWQETMDSWGYKMISAIEAVAEMAAVGFGLQKDAFTSLMKQISKRKRIAFTKIQSDYFRTPFLLTKGHPVVTTNILSAWNSGRSRFPGLNIWLRNGQKVEVKVPVGCLLIQTGKEIEWLTAGECIAGMHEVVVTDRTIDAIKLASEQNRSLWRVSSTLFAHIASDAVLKPLSHFADSP
ncbi:UNVERIFIED_CONTAM: hypothetical protein Scaly_0202000 [Sesamum calycinum]|uniref:Non-haem dioxygenase N-terminal domain-containing protein n=1 Tax=Sesamum calycinum TaxID=2727403 RepID=A0AAW2SXV1_9LAMI